MKRLLQKNEGITLVVGAAGVLALSFMLTAPASAAEIKKSKSNICHDTSSSYYSRVKNYIPYPSINACLDSGGRLPKSRAGHDIDTTEGTSSSRGSGSSEYDRDQFGDGWADLDRDCQNSRHETLIAQSTAPVRFKTGLKCRVTAGRWISPFTGDVIHDPSKIDIDHVVPLAWSWTRGASAWPMTKRVQFANDPANLWSVEASLNRQKGAKGPDQWLPPKNQCQYILRFTRVMKTYDIQPSPTETTALSDLQSQYCRDIKIQYR